MYSVPEALARKPYTVPWEKWPSGGASLGFSVGAARGAAVGVRGSVGFWGDALFEGSLDIDGRGGGARSSCQRFLPIAQTSSHELPPRLRPCVLHSQAMSQARNVIPSTNEAYAT